MLPGKTYTFTDVGRILRLRWWMIVTPLVVGLAAGVFIYGRVPVRYRSETLIMVIPQRVPDAYVKSTVTSNIEDRLRSVSEQILSRSRLEVIIQDFDLYKEQRASGNKEAVIQTMRGDIELSLQGKESAFRISYVNRNPVLAQHVTERLAAQYIAGNLRDRENVADNTSQFLESQLQDAKQRLLEQEKKLEEYRRRYAGQLPSQVQGNLQALQSAQLQLQALGDSLNRARERRLLIERQIADAQSLPPAVVSPTDGSPSPEAAALLAATRDLEAARSRLEAARLRYTKVHPDVVALEQTVRDLEAKVKEGARRLPEVILERAPSPAELARQKRLKDLQAEQDVIDHQLATGQAEEARLKKTIADYQANIDVVPKRESELVELTRDYSTVQAAYSSLLVKREDSKVAANLERGQIGEQFRILDPASLPDRPYNQKQRLAALAGGPIAGLVLGLLVVGFLEYRDLSFKSEDDVVRVLSLPVLALIPLMPSQNEHLAARSGRRR